MNLVLSGIHNGQPFAQGRQDPVDWIYAGTDVSVLQTGNGRLISGLFVISAVYTGIIHTH